MFYKLLSLLRLGMIHPELMTLTWSLKKNKKTYLAYPKMLSIVQSFQQVKKLNPGDMQTAEFGVGNGGSAILLAWLINRYGGTLILFDTFSRIPPPTDEDGQLAQERFQKILTGESADYYGNIPNLISVIKKDLSQYCDLSKISFVQGKYEETLPICIEPRSFGLVHIDCDWYESSKAVLAYLNGNLQTNAILQIDDYFSWQGSAKATNEAEWLTPFRKKQVMDALVIDTGKPAK